MYPCVAVSRLVAPTRFSSPGAAGLAHRSEETEIRVVQKIGRRQTLGAHLAGAAPAARDEVKSITKLLHFFIYADYARNEAVNLNGSFARSGPRGSLRMRIEVVGDARIGASELVRVITDRFFLADFEWKAALHPWHSARARLPRCIRQTRRKEENQLFTLREPPPAHPKTATLAKSTDYRDAPVSFPATMPRGVASIREVWEHAKKQRTGHAAIPQ